MPLKKDPSPCPPANNHARDLIFVVDDESVIADTLRTILTRAGFDVESFYDGPSAIHRAQSTAPNLLLSDIAMPAMDGFALVSRFKELCPSCKTLLFTGNALALEKGRAPEPCEILIKPVPPAELIAKIRFVLHNGTQGGAKRVA
jgi:CheY-like chemotaxis protein